MKHYISDESAATWWTGSRRWQRMLANQARIRMKYLDRIDPNWEGLETLDLGCAGGFMAETLARRGAQVTGIDPWAAVLKTAAGHAQQSSLDVRYLAGAGESLPLDDGSMDRVVCVDTLEHVSNVAAVLAEIRRVLCPGGILFFDTVNRNWLSRLLVVPMAEVVLRLLPPGTHDPGKFIRPAELRAQLEGLGFRVAPMVGMRPALGLGRLDTVLGLLPTTAVMYAGHAVRT